VRVDSGSGARDLRLGDYLDPEAAEAADREANRWIKNLRLAQVDGATLRDRYTYRGDSLWWFTELYLHKQGTVAQALRTIAALQALVRDERPLSIAIARGGRAARVLAPQVARRFNVSCPPARPARDGVFARLDTIGRAWLYSMEALASRIRPAGRPRDLRPAYCAIAAFVHSAFWRRPLAASGEAGHEGYIGPVLDALADALPPGALHLVGVGPRTNFRARAWTDRLADFRDPEARSLPFWPVERFAGWQAVKPSLAVWRDRRRIRRALLASRDLRDAAHLCGVDAWPLVREDLVGVAYLQLPWSARAMDEAGAALDALAPDAAVTYAEAGGWGRALMLEARRRGIPTAGIQHGFIYRHWLNYLHEPDEMSPSPANAADRGFPRPDTTLLFDEHAAQHLTRAGGFAPGSVEVTGSPRLDALVQAAARLTPADLARARGAAGAAPAQHVVLLASKYSQVGPALLPLASAIASMPDVQLVIKCHPAETPAPYELDTAGLANVRVATPDTDLAALTALARLVVTVNSTVAIDAMVLGVPALVVLQPNNLSPFVDAGAMAGAASVDEIPAALERLLYDEEHRQRLARASRDFMARYAIGSDGEAARRAARAILALRERAARGPGAAARPGDHRTGERTSAPR
jgi:hypothetical protein